MGLLERLVDVEEAVIDDDHLYIRGAVHGSMLLFLVRYALLGQFLFVAVMFLPFLFFELLWWKIRLTNPEDDHAGSFAHFWEQIRSTG